MTWTANISGHIEDREQEKVVAERLREVAKEFGGFSFTFNGNKYRCNSLEGEIEDFTATKSG